MNNSNTLAVSRKFAKAKTNSSSVTKIKINKIKLAKISAAFLTLALLISGGLYFNRAYADKIYPKVMVAGVKVGGLTRDEAKTLVDEKINTLENNGPEITYNDQTVKPKLTEMGVTFNTEEILNQAFSYGRTGNIKEKLLKNYQLAATGTTLELKPQIDETKFNDYLSQLAKQVEIPSVDKEVEDGTGTVISEGQDGRSADTDTLKNQIKETLAQGQGGSFALATFVTPRNTKTIYPHAQPGRYAGKYIDINLSEQTLYAFEGNTKVNQFLISSGISSHPSPIGEFNVYNKSVSQKMSGPDYYLPNVPWISWFSGDYSIHGTYWHNNFGHPMSHGCINASIPDAEWIFNWDDVGTPVFVHY